LKATSRRSIRASATPVQDVERQLRHAVAGDVSAEIDHVQADAVLLQPSEYTDAPGGADMQSSSGVMITCTPLKDRKQRVPLGHFLFAAFSCAYFHLASTKQRFPNDQTAGTAWPSQWTRDWNASLLLVSLKILYRKNN
jgi:hypothetical protein